MSGIVYTSRKIVQLWIEKGIVPAKAPFSVWLTIAMTYCVVALPFAIIDYRNEWLLFSAVIVSALAAALYLLIMAIAMIGSWPDDSKR